MGKISKNFKTFFSSNDTLIFIFYYIYFWRTSKFLNNSEKWTNEKLQEYQSTQLKKLIKHAYTNVPYYKKLFDENNLKPEDITKKEDLQKIPFLTKELVRANLYDMKAVNYPDYKFEYVTSGGSTGKPLGLYLEKFVRFSKDLAYFDVLLKRANCNYKNKSVTITGSIFGLGENDRFWRIELFGRKMILSSFHLKENNLPEYIKKIIKFKPKYIFAYPSSIAIIANFMKKNKMPPFQRLRAIICMGETLYDWQRDTLEDVFKCKVFGYYGHTEHTVAGFSCEKSNYHLFPQFGITEIVDKNGKQIKNNGDEGEIVGTGFINFIFPLIRYKTGDIGIYSNKKCLCGLEYPSLKNIIGRSQQFLITKDDRYISIAAINFHSEVTDNIRQMQFYQEKKGEVTLRIVKSENYSLEDTKNIKEELEKRLGKTFIINIEFVSEIPRTERGKYNYLITKIQKNYPELKSLNKTGGNN